MSHRARGPTHSRRPRETARPQGGEDIRVLPQVERRARLEALLQGSPLRISPIEIDNSWLEFAKRREQSRQRGVEGVVILNGKTSHAVLLELFTEHGAGTLIVP